MEKEENWLGRLYLTDRHLCFHGKLNRYLAKVTIRWGDIIRIQPRRDDSGVVDAVKVMSLASKYTLTTFQNDDPPLQEMKIIWQRALEAAQQATQAHRRLDILLRPTSLIGAPGISGGPAVEAFPSIAPLAMPGTLPAASSRHGDGGRGGGERGSANQLSALGQPVGGNGTSSGVSPTPSPSPPPAAGTAPGMAGTPSTTLSTIAVITHPTVANPARGNSIPIASAANTPAIPLTVSSGPISGQAPGSISPPSGGPRDVHPASVSSVAAGGHASGGNGLGPGLVIVAAPSSTLGPGGSVQTPALATAPAIANGTSGGSTIGSGGGGVPAALEATAAAAAGAATGTFRFFSRMVTGGKKRSESASASAGSVAGREMERAAAAAVAAVAEMEGAGAGAGEPPSAVVGLTDPGTDVPTAGSSDRLDGRSAAAAEPPNVMVTPSTPVRSQGSAPSLPAAAAAQLPAVPETTPSPAVVPPPQKQFAPACPCECIDPPLKHSVLNTITAPTSAVAVWRELYGPNAPVFAAAHRARESEALEMPRWRVVTRDDDGVEDESDGDDVDDASDGSLPRAGTERTVSYRVAYYMMGKKLADSTEGQRVVSVFPSDSSSSSSPVPTAFCVESTTKTPNAPYGASFGTLSRVCVHQRAPGVTDVHVRFAVVFSQRVRMMEGKIEQGGVDGCSGLWKEIEKRLRELPADPDEDKDQAVAASSSASQMPATSSVAAGPAPASPIPAKLPTAKPTSPGGGSGVPTKPTTAATTPTAATTTTTTKLLGIIPMRSWKVLLPASRAQARTWKRRMLYAAVALTAANLLYAAWLTAVVSRGVLHLAATNGSGGGPSLPSVIETSPAVAVKVDAKATVTTPTAAAAVVVGNAATAAVLEQWAVSLELRAAALRSEMADLAAMAERVRHLSARSGDDPHIE
ncbi:hypothetical protein BC828DRAFT_391928 [Blastocladiella britannica]|nr:hypothetical protein BC828DRAFT_391928 [Blastocladiella britannica]